MSATVDEPDQQRTDPRILRSRAVIMTAATQHFLRHGYVGANVDDIAAEAQVSKRTVYNIFGGKEQLFRAILQEAADTAERFSNQTVAVLTDAEDVPAQLREIGVKLATTVLLDQVIRLRRLLIGEAERFPELASDYYRRAPGRVMDTLADALADCTRRGVLDVPDPKLAAEQFAFLIIGAPLDRALFEAEAGLPTTEVLEARAAAGVEVFLRSYATAN